MGVHEEQIVIVFFTSYYTNKILYFNEYLLSYFSLSPEYYRLSNVEICTILYSYNRQLAAVLCNSTMMCAPIQGQKKNSIYLIFIDRLKRMRHMDS